MSQENIIRILLYNKLLSFSYYNIYKYSNLILDTFFLIKFIDTFRFPYYIDAYIII